MRGDAGRSHAVQMLGQKHAVPMRIARGQIRAQRLRRLMRCDRIPCGHAVGMKKSIERRVSRIPAVPVASIEHHVSNQLGPPADAADATAAYVELGPVKILLEIPAAHVEPVAARLRRKSPALERRHMDQFTALEHSEHCYQGGVLRVRKCKIN